MDIVRWIEHPRASLCAKQLFCHRVQGERSFAKVMLEKFCFFGGSAWALLGALQTVSLNKRRQLKGKGEGKVYIFFLANYMSGPAHCSFFEGTHYWGPISFEGNQAEGNQPKSPDLTLGLNPYPLPQVLRVEISCHPWNQGHLKWPVSGAKPQMEFQETWNPSDKAPGLRLHLQLLLPVL